MREYARDVRAMASPSSAPSSMATAQTSIVFSELYALTGEKLYRQCARTVNRYLMARHDIRNPDLRLRGGLPGSWPVTGPYGRLAVLNWATKYLVDALSLEARATPQMSLLDQLGWPGVRPRPGVRNRP